MTREPVTAISTENGTTSNAPDAMIYCSVLYRIFSDHLDDRDALFSDRANVFDLHSTSTALALDDGRTRYSEW